MWKNNFSRWLMNLCLIKPTHVLLNITMNVQYKIFQKYFYGILNHDSFSPIKTTLNLCIISSNCFVQQLPFTYLRFLIAVANQWYELKCI